MSKQTSQYSQKVGLPPGSLVYVGKKRNTKVTISEIDYSTDFCEENSIEEVEISENWDSNLVNSWINVNGIHDTAIIAKLGKQLKLDDLVMEDIVNTHQRPKFEELDNYLFVVLKAIKVDNSNNFKKEQLSLLMTENGIVSFQESGSDNYKIIRERLLNKKGLAIKRKADYLFYRMIDTVVDDYFTILEIIEDKINNLEEKILDNPDKLIHQKIYSLKNQITGVKKGTLPIRETVSGILKSDTDLIDDVNQKYYKDVLDHIIQIIDTLDSQKETMNDFLNLYMTAMSNKMNEVMKVLTIFASIFIPLTFIAGIYGMNFEVMPELHWEHGYFITWGIMIAVTILLLNYFRKKKWL